MGLDMYLTGRKFHWTTWGDEQSDRKEDGFRVSTVEVELGYWRKHPNLHGFIVQTFAGGKDECENIELSVEDLRTIITAVKEGKLPKTTGFFFGVSDGSERDEDIEILERALAWAEGGDLSPITVKMLASSPEGTLTQIVTQVGADQQMADIGIKNKPKGQKVSREIIYRASW